MLDIEINNHSPLHVEDSNNMGVNSQFKAKIVHLVFAKKPEEALKRLSGYFEVELPKVKVGMPKRHAKNQGCYVVRKKTIYFSNQDALYNPYVVLHEFYHHLRTQGGEHRGTEKLADAFAKDFLDAYKEMVGIHGNK